MITESVRKAASSANKFAELSKSATPFAKTVTLPTNPALRGVMDTNKDLNKFAKAAVSTQFTGKN